jgi:toxin ParE1/3/4
MKTWLVEYTAPAESDIEDIFCYIARSFHVPETALDQVLRIEQHISELDTMPERYPIFDDDRPAELSLRRMNVDNYAVLFHLNEEARTASIIRVLYGGRDIREVLYR